MVLRQYQQKYIDYTYYDEINQAEFCSQYDQILVLMSHCIILLFKNQVMTPFYSALNELIECLNCYPTKENQPIIHGSLVIIYRIIIDQNVFFYIQSKVEQIMQNISKLLTISLVKQLNMNITMSIIVLKKIYEYLYINTQRCNYSNFTTLDYQQPNQDENEYNNEEQNKIQIVIQQIPNEYQTCDDAVSKQWQQIQQIANKQLKIFDQLVQCYYFSVNNKVHQQAITDLILSVLQYSLQLQLRIFKYAMLPAPVLYFSEELQKAHQQLENYIQQHETKQQQDQELQQLNQQVQSQVQKMLSNSLLKQIRQESSILNYHITKYLQTIYQLGNTDIKSMLLSQEINNSIFAQKVIRNQLEVIQEQKLNKLCGPVLDSYYISSRGNITLEQFLIQQFLYQTLMFSQSTKYKLSLDVQFNQELVNQNIQDIDILSISDIHMFQDCQQIDNKDIIQQFNQLVELYTNNDKNIIIQYGIKKLFAHLYTCFIQLLKEENILENLRDIIYNIVKKGIQIENQLYSNEEIIQFYYQIINQLDIQNDKYQLFILLFIKLLQNTDSNEISMVQMVQIVNKFLSQITLEESQQLLKVYNIQSFDQQICGLQISLSCADQILKEQNYTQQKGYIWIENREQKKYKQNQNIQIINALICNLEQIVIQYQSDLANINKKKLYQTKYQYIQIASILNLVLQQVRKNLSDSEKQSLVQSFYTLWQQIIINLPYAEFFDSQLSSEDISKSQELCVGQAVFNQLQNPQDITYITLFYYLQCQQILKYKDIYTHVSPQMIQTLRSKINTYNQKLVIFECVNELLQLQQSEQSEDSIQNSIFTTGEQKQEYLGENIVDQFKQLKNSFFIVIQQLSTGRSQYSMSDVNNLINILFNKKYGLINNISKDYEDLNLVFYKDNSLQILFSSLNQLLIDEEQDENRLYTQFITACLSLYYNSVINQSELLDYLKQQDVFYYRNLSYSILQLFEQKPQMNNFELKINNRIEKNRQMKQLYTSYYQYVVDNNNKQIYDLTYLKQELNSQYNNKNSIKLYKLNELLSMFVSKSQQVQFKNEQKQLVYITGSKQENIFNIISFSTLQRKKRVEKQNQLQEAQEQLQDLLKEINIEKQRQQQNEDKQQTIIYWLSQRKQQNYRKIFQQQIIQNDLSNDKMLEKIQFIQYLIDRPLLQLYKEAEQINYNQQYLYLLDYQYMQQKDYICQLIIQLINYYNQLFNVKEHNQLILENMFESYLESINSIYNQLQKFQNYIFIKLGDKGLQITCTKIDVEYDLLQQNQTLKKQLQQLFIRFFIFNQASSQQHLILKYLKLYLQDQNQILLENIYQLFQIDEPSEFLDQKYEIINNYGYKQNLIDQIKLSTDDQQQMLLNIICSQYQKLEDVQKVLEQNKDNQQMQYFYNKNYKNQYENNQKEQFNNIISKQELSEDDIKNLQQIIDNQLLTIDELMQSQIQQDQAKQQWYQYIQQIYEQNQDQNKFLIYSLISGIQCIIQCLQTITFQSQQQKDEFEWEDQKQINWDNMEKIFQILSQLYDKIPDYAIQIAQCLQNQYIDQLEDKHLITFCNLLSLHLQSYLFEQQQIEQIISNIQFNINILQEKIPEETQSLIQTIIEIYPQYTEQLQDYMQQEEQDEDEINLQFTSFGRKN